jgi:DNA mismatch endonuclease, patch repair protein
LTDIVDTLTRARMMAGIGSRNTKPELVVRSYLHRAGLRFRVHAALLPGRPDVVLPRHRIAVFVHGCFWHRHARCPFATTPSTRPEFWATKFEGNVCRDRRDRLALARLGWRVETIWECQTRTTDALDRLFWRVVAASCP